MTNWEVREESGPRRALLTPSSPSECDPHRQYDDRPSLQPFGLVQTVVPSARDLRSRRSASGSAAQYLPFADWTRVIARGSFAVDTVTRRGAAASIRPFWISATKGDIANHASPSD